MRSIRLLTAGAVALGLFTTACGLFDVPNEDDILDGLDIDIPTLPTLGGAPYGDSCESALDCRFGLICLDDDTCGVDPQPQAGEECVATAECADDLICAPNLQALENPASGAPLALCAERGDAQENEPCATDLDCAAGFRCTYLGFSGICGPDGDVDFGQPCQDTSECQAPLACTVREDLGIMEPACFYPIDVFMPDVTCTSRNDEEPIRFYFEVPGDETVDEFYRLPFPNDIRLSNGRPDLSGHHNPGPQYLGGDLVAGYINYLEQESDGFSTNPTIFFRSSRAVDASSVQGGGDNPTIFFRNIDPDSPNFGAALAMAWYVDPNAGKFICQDYIAVHPSWSSPLEHGTTYAVWITNGVTDDEGNLPLVDDDFAAVIGNSRPSDARLGAAWDAYEPLRSYLEGEGIGTDSLLTAAVFTTGNPDADLPAVRAGVRAQAVPTLDNVTICGDGVTSPCDDGSGERGCSASNPDYYEVHATYAAPIWQEGTRPYIMDSEGGNLVFSNGEAVPQGVEEICVSMTIPRGLMPEAGWPVVMSAHGTGGSFLSHISNDSGPNVGNIQLDDGTVQMVSISIDGVQHANRRGDSDLSAETLFYNFVNPLAARGNVQQGAADYMMLSYMLESMTLNIDGAEMTFDPDQRYFFGHSQGATVGSLMLPFERTVRGAILSGAGGSLTLSLLNKTSPEDIAGAVDFALTDGTGEATQFDPLLALLQWWIDPVDPLNVARQYWRDVPEGEPGQHVFMSYGYGDTYTPEPNMRAFGGAAGVQLGTPANGDLSGFREVAYPVSGNVASNGEPITSIIVPGTPSGFDGHFIVFRDGTVRARSLEFLGTAVRDGVPTVSE